MKGKNMKITREEIEKMLATMKENNIKELELDFGYDLADSVDEIDFDHWENNKYCGTILSIKE